MYTDIKWKHFEIWKVYKLEKCIHGPVQPNKSTSFHFLEFTNIKMLTSSDILDSNETYKLYSYYDTSNDFENYLYRNSSEVLGIKINEKENE